MVGLRRGWNTDLVRWDTVSRDGIGVPAGLYFARFATPGMTRLSRIIVLP